MVPTTPSSLIRVRNSTAAIAALVPTRLYLGEKLGLVRLHTNLRRCSILFVIVDHLLFVPRTALLCLYTPVATLLSYCVEANPVKVYGDASFIFPLVVAKTFAKAIEAQKAEDAAAAAAGTAEASADAASDEAK